MFIVCIIFIHVFVLSLPLRAPIQKSFTHTVLPFFSTYSLEGNTEEENNGYVVFKSLSTDQLAKGWGLGGVTPSAPIPFLPLFKEDCTRESLLQHPNGML
jgi:hypothetical protein